MAGIIKAGAANAFGGDIQQIAFNFDDMNDKASAYLDQVRRQAALIVAKANQEAHQVRIQAEEHGRNAALREVDQSVQKKVDERMKTLLPAVKKAIGEIINSKHAWIKHWEENAIHLSIAIAEKVIRRQLKDAPSIASELVREALELAAGGDHIKVHLNPLDYETLGEQMKLLADEIGSISPTDIISDPQISIGGCRVSTEYGDIDQQFESQLLRIEEELK